jgi:hypothetical protein
MRAALLATTRRPALQKRYRALFNSGVPLCPSSPIVTNPSSRAPTANRGRSPFTTAQFPNSTHSIERGVARKDRLVALILFVIVTCDLKWNLIGEQLNSLWRYRSRFKTMPAVLNGGLRDRSGARLRCGSTLRSRIGFDRRTGRPKEMSEGSVGGCGNTKSEEVEKH